MNFTFPHTSHRNTTSHLTCSGGRTGIARGREREQKRGGWRILVYYQVITLSLALSFPLLSIPLFLSSSLPLFLSSSPLFLSSSPLFLFLFLS